MWLTGLAALRHVGPSRTRARTRVPCIGRRIPKHCATREAPGLFIFFNFMYLFLAALGLPCCMQAPPSCGERGPLPAAVYGPPTVAEPPAPAAEHGLQARGPQQLWHAGPAAVAHRLSCSVACGILPDQGSNLCPPRWQVDSQPLRHQEAAGFFFTTSES